jgi:CubicO group peptidase (beta-lactamase class C family)
MPRIFRSFGLACVAGLLVIEDGHVRLERYALGNTDTSRWTPFSVGKSIVSTLVGAAVKALKSSRPHPRGRSAS